MLYESDEAKVAQHEKGDEALEREQDEEDKWRPRLFLPRLRLALLPRGRLARHGHLSLRALERLRVGQTRRYEGEVSVSRDVVVLRFFIPKTTTWRVGAGRGAWASRMRASIARVCVLQCTRFVSVSSALVVLATRQRSAATQTVLYDPTLSVTSRVGAAATSSAWMAPASSGGVAPGCVATKAPTAFARASTSAGSCRDMC